MEQLEKNTNEYIFNSDFTKSPKSSSDLNNQINDYSKLSIEQINAVMLVELKLMNKRISRIQFITSLLFNISLIAIGSGILYYLFKTFA